MSLRRSQDAARPRAATDSDAALVARLAEGDLDAMGELYERHQARVRRFIARSTGDAEDVDDLVQATFLAAAASSERYDGRAHGAPWLVGIAARLIRRRHRGLGRLSAVLSKLKNAAESYLDPRPSLEARRDVERALSRLSEAKRMTLLLAEVEGLSCAEVAAALGVPIGTVWTRLHAARRELRSELHLEVEP